MRLLRLIGPLLCLAQAGLLGAARGGPFVYAAVPLPPGEMKLEVPLNTFLNTDYLAIPVKIKPGLSIGKYEVSRRQWQACHQAGACAKPGLPAEGAGPDYPMVKVDWFEARQFARWYAKATGKRWRLPTEQEWFYAASLGKGWRVEEKQYDYSDIDKVRATPKLTYPGGHFGENAWGIADLQGNVWEWTLSCYTLAADKLLKPVDIAALDKPGCCSSRITGGEHRAEVPDFVDDTYNGGCSGLKPAANLGLRLVLEEEP